MIHFEVDDILSTSADSALIEGRLVGGALEKGSKFSTIILSETASMPIELYVTEILAYRNSLNQLYSGMSAQLVVIGGGLEELRKHKRAILVASEN